MKRVKYAKTKLFKEISYWARIRNYIRLYNQPYYELLRDPKFLESCFDRTKTEAGSDGKI